MREKKKIRAGILRGAFLVPADAVPPFFIRRYSERRYTYHRCLFGATASAGTNTAIFYSALQRAPVHIPPFFIRRYSERRYKKPRVFSLSLKARNYHCQINFYAIHKSYLEVTTPDLNSGQETIGDFVYSGKEKWVRTNFQYRLAEHGGLPLRWFLLSQQR